MSRRSEFRIRSCCVELITRFLLKSVHLQSHVSVEALARRVVLCLSTFDTISTLVACHDVDVAEVCIAVMIT